LNAVRVGPIAVIEKAFGQDEAAAALRHLDSTHARATIVVSRTVHAVPGG
jgi:hypothetical protein